MYLGIEIGGTKLQLGLGPGDGTLAAIRRLPVDLAGGAPWIRKQIKGEVPKLLGDAAYEPAHIRGLGIGFGGPVDDATRRVLKSHQVSGWDDFPLAEWAEREFGMPAVLGNDSDLAGLAEALFGAGQGLSPIFYTNVGSGIGGALIIDGRIYRGAGKGAGEIGHLWTRYDLAENGPPHESPSWKVVEHCSSGWAIARQAGMASAQDVAAAARAGDLQAQAALRAAIRSYALAITHVIALCCPRRMVVGGGVSLMGEDLFLRPLREEVARMVFRPFADCYDIAAAALGEEVVVHGALAMARQAFPLS
jgi:glucokinase